MLMLQNSKYVLTMQQAQGPASKQAVAKACEADDSLGVMHGQTAKPLDAKQVPFGASLHGPTHATLPA